MNKRQIWQKVHDLKNKKGLGRNEISRRLNISKTTVLRILNKEEPVETVRCEECGKEFIPNKFSPNQRFCCDHCRRLYWRKKYKKLGQDKKILLTCHNCGRLFYADRKTVKYCSRLCYLNVVTRHE